jgi:choline dehydrogenase-like flavoprotein
VTYNRRPVRGMHPTDEPAVVVLGSGPTGAIAARTLVNHGVPVTLLESGTSLPRGLLVRVLGRNLYRKWPQLQHPANHLSGGDPDTKWFYDLVPGGLSNHWGGAVPRFSPEDFVDGRRLHERYVWPVSYEELVPYYEEVESLLGVAGGRISVSNLPASRITYAQRFPVDWCSIAGHAETVGQGLAPMPSANGRPWGVLHSGAPFNSYISIVRNLTGSRNFRLVLGAHALRIECSTRTRASGVVYFDRFAGCQRHIAARAVVLAAGPLASTKLLLDSACSEFPEGLGNTHGVLGKYLHDHVLTTFSNTLDRTVRSLPYPAYLTRAPYRESPPLIAAGSVLTTIRSKTTRAAAALGLGSRWIGGATFGTTIPSEHRYVSLHPTSKDRFGLSQLAINMRFTDTETQNLASARDRLTAILDAAGFHWTHEFDTPGSSGPGMSIHFGGTVRMHRSPEYGMLDCWNRLHAIANIAVVDASAFTTGVEKNPTLTAMALSARAADRLAQSLREF